MKEKPNEIQCLINSPIIGCGEMPDSIRSFDWSSTPLGPIDAWPAALLATVNTVLNSRFPFLIWWGPKLLMLYNDAFVPILGNKHRRALGQPGRRVWAEPEAWSIIEQHLQKVLTDGTASWSEDQMILLKRSGFLEETYITWSTSPIYIEDGSVGGILTSATEVTARVLGERRLKTLRSLGSRLDDASTAADVVNMSAEIMSENACDVPFTALYLSDPTDPGTLNLVSTSGLRESHAAFPMTLSAHENAHWPIAAALSQSEQLVVSNLGPEGAVFPGGPHASQAHRAALLPISSSDLAAPSGVWIVGLSPVLPYDLAYQDFFNLIATQLSSALASTRSNESERKRLSLADSMPLLVAEFDARWKVIYGNQHWRDLFCNQGFHASGRPLIECVHPEDRERVQAECTNAIHEKRRAERELRLRMPDGEYRWYLGRAEPTFNCQKEITGWYATATDIQKQKDLEAKLVDAKRTAETANKTKSMFLANMSHEIRTPMTAVLGFIEILREPKLPARDRADFINRIEQSGRVLLRLIDDILDISKIEVGRLGIEEERFSPWQALQDVTAMLRLQAHVKGVEIHERAEWPLPDTVVSDPTRFRQILVNLIGNAVKFTDKGAIDIAMKVDGLGEGDTARLLVEVKDSGIGIAKEHQPHLFQPFSQADGSITRRFGGTGLGLALAKRIAERLGGDLRLVESAYGVGSCFETSIEVRGLEKSAVIYAPTANVMTMEAPQAMPESLHGVHILLAEDVPDNQVLIRRFLESAGASVEIADNGREALDLASARQFDLILMDVQMPDLDGLEATRALRLAGHREPILALTAHAMREERELSLRAGCDDHLTKPINRVQLIRRIKQTLASRLH